MQPWIAWTIMTPVVLFGGPILIILAIAIIEILIRLVIGIIRAVIGW